LALGNTAYIKFALDPALCSIDIEVSGMKYRVDCMSLLSMHVRAMMFFYGDFPNSEAKEFKESLIEFLAENREEIERLAKDSGINQARARAKLLKELREGFNV
jgi:hypothetical protein